MTGGTTRARRGPASTRPAESRFTWRHLPALDGLRAAAVVAVLLFHAGHLQGGFLGVDLFFALSGFLITSLLLRDADRGGVRLLAFWGRRFRRLLPAVFVLIAVVALGAWMFGSPADLDGVRRTGGWSLAYMANWHFISEANGYWASFDQPSMFDHLWSLAIEEQFYVVWPIVVLAVWKLSRRRYRQRNLLVGLARRCRRVVHRDARPVRPRYGPDAGLHGHRHACRFDPRRRGDGDGARPATRDGGSSPLWVAAADLVIALLTIGIGVSWLVFDGASSAALYRGGLLVHSVVAALVVSALVSLPARSCREGAVVGVRSCGSASARTGCTCGTGRCTSRCRLSAPDSTARRSPSCVSRCRRCSPRCRSDSWKTRSGTGCRGSATDAASLPSPVPLPSSPRHWSCSPIHATRSPPSTPARSPLRNPMVLPPRRCSDPRCPIVPATRPVSSSLSTSSTVRTTTVSTVLESTVPDPKAATTIASAPGPAVTEAGTVPVTTVPASTVEPVVVGRVDRQAPDHERAVDRRLDRLRPGPRCRRGADRRRPARQLRPPSPACGSSATASSRCSPDLQVEVPGSGVDVIVVQLSVWDAQSDVADQFAALDALHALVAAERCAAGARLVAADGRRGDGPRTRRGDGARPRDRRREPDVGRVPRLVGRLGGHVRRRPRRRRNAGTQARRSARVPVGCGAVRDVAGRRAGQPGSTAATPTPPTEWALGDWVTDVRYDHAGRLLRLLD